MKKDEQVAYIDSLNKHWEKCKSFLKLKCSNAENDKESETGLDRIKSLFRVRYGEPLPEELHDFPLTVFVASCVGFFFGGMIGSRLMADKFIAMNHHSKFSSTMQAQRQLHSAAMLGFVRHGSKWGWKIGLFAGIFSGTKILLMTYRDRDDGLNYIVAGGVTGGLFRVRWGLMPTIGGTVLGLLVSFPLGLLVFGADTILVGKEEKSKTREKLHEARKDREKRWKEKLDATSVIIDQMDSSVKAKGLQTCYDTKNTSNSANPSVNSVKR